MMDTECEWNNENELRMRNVENILIFRIGCMYEPWRWTWLYSNVSKDIGLWTRNVCNFTAQCPWPNHDPIRTNISLFYKGITEKTRYGTTIIGPRLLSLFQHREQLGTNTSLRGIAKSFHLANRLEKLTPQYSNHRIKRWDPKGEDNRTLGNSLEPTPIRTSNGKSDVLSSIELQKRCDIGQTWNGENFRTGNERSFFGHRMQS